uniref:Uncharacterized protein n=1 Tax=Globisporangium ultimum (strain ATCC 200006 / CBS 805.95 / DAOM BR144) TaxID=431595 RepID=K3WC85_GLOUD
MDQTIAVMSGHNRTDIKVFAVCATTLYVKFLATTMIQGRKSFSAGTRTPEDNKLPMAKGYPLQSFRTQQDQLDDKAMKLTLDTRSSMSPKYLSDSDSSK